MTTKEIDLKTDELIKKYGVRSAFKGYRGFPGCACISVNEGVVHGIGNSRVIVGGILFPLMLGSFTMIFIPIPPRPLRFGTIDEQKQRLLDVAQASLYKGIEAAQVGARLSDISFSVQSYVELHGLLRGAGFLWGMG